MTNIESMQNNPADKALLRRFYIISGLQACYFATGNWYFLWRLYLTNGGIGLVDAACFALGIVFQIPAGALADTFGRRRMMLIASVLMGIGYGFTGFARNGGMILIGYAIYSIGMAFYAGADDALMYDHLKKQGREDDWRQIANYKYIAGRIGALVATFVGGYLFLVSVRVPSITRGVFFLLPIPLILLLPENRGREKDAAFAFIKFGRQIKDGIAQLLKIELRPLLWLVITFGAVVETMYVGGLLRPLLLAKFGLGGYGQAIFISVAFLVTIILLYLTGKGKRKSEWLVYATSFVMLLGFSLTITNHTIAALAGIFAMQTAYGLFAPATSNVLNRHIASEHRATALSAVEMIKDVPYIFLAPVIGHIADIGKLSALCVVITLVLAVGLLLSLISQRGSHILTNE